MTAVSQYRAVWQHWRWGFVISIELACDLQVEEICAGVHKSEAPSIQWRLAVCKWK